MPTLEAGLFVFMLVLSFLFTFFAWRTIGAMSGLLHMVAMAFFVMLAIYMASGYGVGITEKGGSQLIYNSTGKLIQNVTQQDKITMMIPGSTSSYWLWYVFFGFAIMNLSMFIRDVWQPGGQRE